MSDDEVFTQPNFYTEKFWHRGASTQRVFTHRRFYTDAFARTSFSTEKPLHRAFLCRGAFSHKSFCTENSRGTFSRMRSKGSRFTLGVWGLRVCSLDVAQPSATVRNRPRHGHMAVPMESSAEGVVFGRFICLWCCFVSRSRRGPSWHSDMFCNVSKVVLCGRRNTFTALQFRGRRSTLSFRVAGAARCVFLRIALAGLRQVATDKVQIPWQAWHFVRYAENWRKPRTIHRFWGSKCRGS